MRRAKRAWAGAILILMTAAVTGCRRTQPAVPADVMLDAIRSEERVGGLTYGEGQGKHLFAQYCSTCHGDDGHGDGQNASNLNPPPPDLTVSKNARDAAYLRRVIGQGSAAIGRSALSPPWGRSLSPQQIDYLVAYCAALGRQKR
jgi:mono/diheme cytochrome c family protein